MVAPYTYTVLEVPGFSKMSKYMPPPLWTRGRVSLTWTCNHANMFFLSLLSKYLDSILFFFKKKLSVLIRLISIYHSMPRLSANGSTSRSVRRSLRSQYTHIPKCASISCRRTCTCMQPKGTRGTLAVVKIETHTFFLFVLYLSLSDSHNWRYGPHFTWLTVV